MVARVDTFEAPPPDAELEAGTTCWENTTVI